VCRARAVRGSGLGAGGRRRGRAPTGGSACRSACEAAPPPPPAPRPRAVACDRSASLHTPYAHHHSPRSSNTTLFPPYSKTWTKVRPGFKLLLSLIHIYITLTLYSRRGGKGVSDIPLRRPRFTKISYEKHCDVTGGRPITV
jgi:hypothetical protein